MAFVTPLARRAPMMMLRQSRAFTSTAPTAMKVCVVGAAGGIGQPMSMLLKATGKVDHLALYDMVNSPGVAADISHCPADGIVTGHGPDQMSEALTGCDVVVVPAGVPRKPGMTRDDLFNTNANINKGIAEACAQYCPKAAFLIISNPVNSTVPIWSKVLEKAGVYDKKKLMGVTTLDVCRARRFVAENQGTKVADVQVTVIGGHAGTTIIPLLSQVKGAKFSDADRDALTHRIQFGGDEVVKAKDGAGSATLSMAVAGAHFTEKVIDGLNGVKGVKECAFVQTDLTSAPFFATPVTLGKGGVEEVHHYGDVSPYEQKIIDDNIVTLTAQAEKGFEAV